MPSAIDITSAHTTSPRPLAWSLALLVGTLLAGLAFRFARIGLPPFLVKYGGSFFWAMLIYWLITTVLARWRVSAAALLAAGVAVGVEFFKLVRTPALDAFRLTLPGVLVLGRFFSLWDIVAYLLAIGAAAAIDRALRRRRFVT
jgi:hypothetical protein